MMIIYHNGRPYKFFEESTASTDTLIVVVPGRRTDGSSYQEGGQ